MLLIPTDLRDAVKQYLLAASHPQVPWIEIYKVVQALEALAEEPLPESESEG